MSAAWGYTPQVLLNILDVACPGATSELVDAVHLLGAWVLLECGIIPFIDA